MIFLDTNIAIALRDLDDATLDRIETLDEQPVISIISRIELENGVYRQPELSDLRRQSLDRVLQSLRIEYFGESDILTYGRIIRALGHDRRCTLDRLIAAQVLDRDAVLITRNVKDFRNIPGLKLIAW
ncbi:MAG: PIN domain-containing protein [Proteobacteria bacterium]|nr:PIN domain-containing protein [Pseudomonadota bacterium]